MSRTSMLSAGAAAVACMVAPALMGQPVDWTDGFEDYGCGTALGGQGIWDCWDGDCAQWDSFVNCDVVRTGSNSVEITGNSDSIAVFDGDECGTGVITAYVFVPSDIQGPTWFIMQNLYNHGGPYNWSVQMRMDPDLGVVEPEFWGENFQLPLVTDQWVEIRVEVDLDNDVQTQYYNGEVLIDDITWTDGLNNGSAGEQDIGAIDLWANGSTSAYYDDLSVSGFSTNCGPCQTFEIDNLVGGQTATFSVSSPDNPNANFGVIYFLNENAAQDFADCVRDAPSNNLNEVAQCYGGDPRDTLACQGRLNGSGDGQCSVRVPGAGSGRTVSFVSVVQTTEGFCPSDVITQTIL